MAKWEAKNIVLTSDGRIALSKVQSGDGFLTITKVVASSQYVDPINLEQVTVIDPQNVELEIISRRESRDGGSVIQVMLNNVNLREEFILNQIGVFASHSSNPQAEFLYIIAQVSENSGDRVPVYSVTPVSCTYDIFLYNVKASDIVVNISPNFFVTADDLFSNAKVLRRSFSYKEGDIAYDSTLRSCYNLKCVVAGTSSGQTIDFSTYTNGDRITDGGVVWKVIEGAGGGAGGKWSCDKTDLYNVVMRPLTPAEQEDEPDEGKKHTFQEIVDSAVSNISGKTQALAEDLPNHESSNESHKDLFDSIKTTLNTKALAEDLANHESSNESHKDLFDSVKIALNTKANKEDLANHESSNESHKDLFDSIKIALNTKANKEDLDKLSVKDYVVESYSEGKNWYRKFKSGWVEQGGVLPVSTKVVNKVVSLLKPFATKKYTVLTQNYHDGETINANSHFESHSISRFSVFNFTTTSFKVYYGFSSKDGLEQKIWYACGQGAEE